MGFVLFFGILVWSVGFVLKRSGYDEYFKDLNRLIGPFRSEVMRPRSLVAKRHEIAHSLGISLLCAFVVCFSQKLCVSIKMVALMVIITVTSVRSSV